MMHIVLFGAGHVGRALVHILGLLPCSVHWVDTRDDAFPDETPPNVLMETADIATTIVDESPPDTYFLVITHDHSLDFDLARRIMNRDDFAYFGMIGSQTKRVKFERRFLARGMSKDPLSDMTCPIGIEGITGKAPSSIALSVAAQLLQIRAH